MTEDSVADQKDEEVSTMQKVLDNPFILLFLGVATPMALYILWGVMNIIGIPVAK